MHPFAYTRAPDERAAIDTLAREPAAAVIAGGTDLLQLWKAGVSAPTRLVDISALPYSAIEITPLGVSIGALARMSDVADHRGIRESYPAIAEALSASASAQVRNMATIGGNLLQRTRCAYFRDSTLPCNKRRPGLGCGAIRGENRMHAILGGSDKCVATHASDLAVALVALDAVLYLRGHGGERHVSLEDFYLLPNEDPQSETVLNPGELIVSVEVPSAAHARRSHYLKVRDRASFEFALVSAAVGVDSERGVIRSARVAIGGVGTKPWRLRAVENALAGAPVAEVSFRRAAEHAADGASPLAHNGFKVALMARTLVRALQIVGEQL